MSTRKITVADPDDFEAIGLRPRKAAQLLDVSVSTLERWRATACGPRYFQDGRTIIYPREELVRWLHEAAGIPPTEKTP